MWRQITTGSRRMLTFRASRSLPLSFGTLSGRFCAEQVIAEVQRAYDAGDLRRGRDRVVYVDDAMDNDFAVSEIADVQSRIYALERENAGGKSYNAVFVGGPRHVRISLAIYVTLWEQNADFKPHFCHVRTIPSVETIVGCTGLAAELTGMAGQSSLRASN